MTVFEMIEAQQKGHEGTTVFTVGEHLKMICRADPACEQIVAEDLQQKGMGIADCEKQIKALADEIHKKNKSNRVGVDFFAAEDTIRKFYGLPERVAEEADPSTPIRSAQDDKESGGLGLDLGDLLGL